MRNDSCNEKKVNHKQKEWIVMILISQKKWFIKIIKEKVIRRLNKMKFLIGLSKNTFETAKVENALKKLPKETLYYIEIKVLEKNKIIKTKTLKMYEKKQMPYN